MSEITSDGYEDIGEYIKDNWKILKFFYDNSPKLSFVIGNDLRISREKREGKIIINALFRGSDSDISILLPLSLNKVELYKEGSDKALISESFSQVNINNANDIFYFYWEIQIPNITEGGAM